MKIGVPKEIENHESRVGLVPSSVRELVCAGHSVVVQSGAGLSIGLSDQDYQVVGATIVTTPEEVFGEANLIVKVKEPQLHECAWLTDRHTLFTYLHLAPDLKQAEALMRSGCTAIAYETVTDSKGGLPLLSPMSEVAGRMSIQVGAHALEKAQGGRGILLGGVGGVAAADIVVLGGGVVGTNALRMAVGMEASVTVIDKSLQRLRELDYHFGARLNTIYATQDAIDRYVARADLVIGAVLVPGESAPQLITRAMLKEMKPGSVLVDVAIDQGGCFETSKPTTHSEPTYLVDGIVHYCVANMPGGVARTSSFALNNSTLPFVLALASKGARQACTDDVHLLRGLNVHRGHITHDGVARALKMAYLAPEHALAM